MTAYPLQPIVPWLVLCWCAASAGASWAQTSAPTQGKAATTQATPAPTAPLPSAAPAAIPSASAPGVTQALRDVKLSMTVAGRIDGMLVREGSRVSKGQVLMYLDKTLEELEVQRRRLQQLHQPNGIFIGRAARVCGDAPAV